MSNVNSVSGGKSGPERSSESPKKNEQPDEKDQDRFESALKKKNVGERDGEKQGSGENMFSQFSGMTESMLGKKADGQLNAAQQSASSAGMDEAKVSQIAERILVSADNSTQPEVRIQLKDDVLAGTEVRISKDADGLRIELHTDNSNSEAFLAKNVQNLESRLTDRTGEAVQVSLVRGGADADTPGDGRSRNQRDVYEETQAQENDNR